jgi:trimethylamine--corrinoid protein Co-methyltransferase
LGHEKTLTGLIAALAGANLIYGPGMLESGITFDFAQLVLDNEFARMIKQTVRGFSVNDESLAVDVIKSVGPSKDFLAQEHTLKHMRAHSRPELIDRSDMEMWQASGATDSYQRAVEKTRDILQNHKPDPLPEEVLAEMRSIITETEGEMGV